MTRTLINRLMLASSFAVISISGVAAAQDPIEAALSGARPAGSACVKEPDTPDRALPATRDLAPPDLSCAMSVPALAELRADPNVLIVDTRTEREFAEYHIDSALNMAWGELRARKYLHSRPIVLVGGGKGASTLYTACAELKLAGVTRVHVLRGGMSAWAKAQQPIVGRAPDALEQAMLSEEELLDELAFSSNVVLALPSARALQKQIPRAVVMNGADARALERILRQREREVGAVPFSSLVILGGVDTRPAELALLLQAAGDVPVLFYTGTERQYSEFMKSKRAVWLASARGPVSPRCPAM